MRGTEFKIPVVISILLASFLISSGSARAETLSPSESSWLRFELQNITDDLELTIRNHAADELDLRNEDRAASELEVWKRIPFEDRRTEIPEQLSRSAKQNNVAVCEFRFDASSETYPRIPRRIVIGKQSFRLPREDVAAPIDFRFIARAKPEQLTAWIRGWHRTTPRLIELLGPPHRLKNGEWQIRARAFRFRSLKYPALEFQDARSLLPSWALKDPSDFARQQPLLWSLVQRAEKEKPRALPLLKTKERFLLEDARMSFFLLKASAAPKVRLD